MFKSFKLLTVILIFVLIFSSTVGAINLKDVPKEHWAYKSVKRLVEKGYLTLYEDGTFSGEKKVTRYELAVLVARMLDNINQGKKETDIQDVERLRQLSVEFRDELVEVAERQEVFSKSLTKVQKDIKIIKNGDLAEVHEELQGVEEKITNLEKLNTSINANEQEIEKIIDNILKVKNLEEEVATLKSQITKMQKDLQKTKVQIEEKKGAIEEYEKLNRKIEDQNAIALTRIQTLEKRIEKMENKLTTQQDTEKEVKKSDENSSIYLGAAAIIILLAAMN